MAHESENNLLVDGDTGAPLLIPPQQPGAMSDMLHTSFAAAIDENLVPRTERITEAPAATQGVVSAWVLERPPGTGSGQVTPLVQSMPLVQGSNGTSAPLPSIGPASTATVLLTTRGPLSGPKTLPGRSRRARNWPEGPPPDYSIMRAALAQRTGREGALDLSPAAAEPGRGAEGPPPIAEPVAEGVPYVPKVSLIISKTLSLTDTQNALNRVVLPRARCEQCFGSEPRALHMRDANGCGAVHQARAPCGPLIRSPPDTAPVQEDLEVQVPVLAKRQQPHVHSQRRATVLR